jgi:hypothetical protein
LKGESCGRQPTLSNSHLDSKPRRSQSITQILLLMGMRMRTNLEKLERA